MCNLIPKDMQITTFNEGLCTNVVIDGRVIEEHLKALNLNVNWLHKELSQQNIDEHTEVLLAYVNTAGILHAHMKDTRATKNISVT